MQRAKPVFEVRGGTPLRGELTVNAAKNSALYLILASLLTDENVVLEGVPRLADVLVSLEILEHIGVRVHWEGRDLHLHAQTIERCSAPYSLVSKMRASFVAMGALLARCGEARISMPGGCAFGPRPVDRHIAAFKALGVEVDERAGDFSAVRRRPLEGTVVFEAPTVGGTQNVILAAALGSGTVTIENAALEPEVADLAAMLGAMGATIEGAGSPVIRIAGVDRLRGVRFRPMPDRIEAGTFMLATAATRGHVEVNGVRSVHVQAVLDKLVETGVRVVLDGPTSITIDATGELAAADVTAREYPGIPTDLQAPFGAYLATLPGVSVVRDRVYPDRFTHVAELARMGAKVELTDRTLVVRGGSLRGAEVHAADIRAGGALVVATLAAEGASTVTGVEYVDRGYEHLAPRLAALGADIERRSLVEVAIRSG
ncbi:MAG: UDP-N-acetylglucosamine 1-carboxyvinyltransferase [Trueperaceae bacterium]|nr:UDP-N-acetylglucosamine 1-carboxyvinyltransferase [Trueperaceae bacterium]